MRCRKRQTRDSGKGLHTLGEQLARDGRFGERELKAVIGFERVDRLAAPYGPAFRQ
jgi:hypothetical protein